MPECNFTPTVELVSFFFLFATVNHESFVALAQAEGSFGCSMDVILTIQIDLAVISCTGLGLYKFQICE